MARKKTTPKRFATHITAPSGERLYFSASTKEELAEKVAKVKLEMGSGVDIGDRTTFREYALLWARVYKEPRLRANSYATLKANLENHVIPAFGDTPLREIKPMHVQLFLNSMRGLSVSVQRKCIQIADGVFRTAVANNILMKSPMSQDDKPIETEKEKDVKPLTQEQSKVLLRALEGTRAHLFCLLALTLGLRRGELLGLMWSDIDFSTGFLTVTHNKTFLANANDAPVTEMLKSDAAHRRIPVPASVLEVLRQEQAGSNSPYVFSMQDGSSLTKSSFRRMWAAVEVRTADKDRALGSTVPGGRNGPIEVLIDFECHPHQLRHTCITQWVESGMPFKRAQYLAGHSTPNMTLRVYADYRHRSQEEEAARDMAAASAYLLS